MNFKKTSLLAAIAVGMAYTPSCTSANLTASSTTMDSVSYALGVNMGHSLQQMKQQMKLTDYDIALLTQGIRDVLVDSGKNAKFTNESSIQLLQAFFAQRQQELMEESKKASEENKKAGEAFLEENKTKEGVMTTASGLQYKITTEGTGPKPTATDEVQVHYRGTTLDGKEFDSSYKRGEPVTFPLDGVIKGWTEAFQLLNEGSKATLWIPSDLAYGERTTGSIEPNSTLVFEVELLKVNPNKDTTATKDAVAPKK